MRKRTFLAASSLCLNGFIGVASYSTQASASSAANMNDAPDALIVTATNIETPVYQLGHALTVFDQQDIERSKPVLLTDMLIQSAGVTMTRVGGPGQASTVRIRGGDSDHVLLVIDGVRMTDPATTGGGSDFSEIMIGDISQIEILRGPQSTLWGSQAISGVVNVVTAMPSNPFEGKAQVELGSRNTTNARAAFGGKSSRLSWRIAGNYYSTDGISSLDKRMGGKETDGFRNQTLSTRLVYNATDNLVIDLRGYYSKGETDLDNISAKKDTPAYTLSRQLIGYAGLRLDMLSGRLSHRLSFQYTDSDGSRRDPSLAVPVTRETTGRTNRVSYQGVFAASDKLELVAGAETQDTYVRYRSPSVSNPNAAPRINNIDLDSLYGHLKLEALPGLTFTGGIRHDHHQNFGGHTNLQAAAAWRFNNENTIIRTSWGQGYNAPTAYQLFDARYGNEDVRPEDTKGNWDASIEQRFFDGQLALTAGYFRTRTRNLIVVTYCTAEPNSVHCAGTGRPGYYSNVEKAQSEGVELQASLRLQATKLNANYTFTKARDAISKLDLARSPRHTANFTVDHEWNDVFSTGTTLRYVGASYNDAANTVKFDDFLLINARISAKLSDTVELYLRADNIFNKYYVTNLNYGTEGRSVYFGFRTSF